MIKRKEYSHELTIQMRWYVVLLYELVGPIWRIKELLQEIAKKLKEIAEEARQIKKV